MNSDYPTTQSPNYPIHLLATVVVAAAVVVSLAAGLRPDSFYSGDPGVKLIAVRSILDHPSRPFDVTLPRLGGSPVPYVEPFFRVHGDHAHAITSPVFPILTAPFFRALGMRGLYVLPAAGFLLSVAAAGWLAAALDARRRPVVAALVTALGTPLIFYGLEFWEHSLAVGLAGTGLALFVRRQAIWSGLALGAAILLRPEAAWLAAAAFVASFLLPRRPGVRDLGLAVAGILLALAPLELYALLHNGDLVPLHVSSNVGDIAQGWLESRLSLISLWFVAGTEASFWRVAPVAIGALTTLALPSRAAGRAFLWTVAFLDIVLVLASAPNDGGAQWGPRYLLFAYLPLAVLAADGVESLPLRHVGTAIALGAVLILSIWVQRNGYRQLRGTKITYGRVVDFVTSEAPEGTTIATDLWWLDQITAASLNDRTMLYAADAGTGRTIVSRLSDAGVPSVTIIRSTTESPDLSSWSDGTCYREERRDTISTRNLVAIRLVNGCVSPQQKGLLRQIILS